MIKKILKLVCSGIGWGCTMSCLISMIGTGFLGNEWFISAPKSFTAQVIAAMLIGMGWVIPSVVYANEKLSRIQQFIIHFGTGIIINLIIAFYMQWIPVENPLVAVMGILIGIVTSLAIWYCFYLYYRNEAKAINRGIKSKEY